MSAALQVKQENRLADAAWLNERYGHLDGRDLLEVMIREVFPGRIALVSSFGSESAVLIDMVARIDTATPILFLNTGKLFGETLRYRDTLQGRFGLGERAAAICPSVLGIEPRPLCKSLNEANIQAIRDVKPDVVILYSWWHNKRYDLRNLEATVAEIKKAGVPRIIMLGAVPYWKKQLPQILLEEWKKGPPMKRPPMRLKDEFLDPGVRAATASMRARAQKMNIEFISGMDYFCNEQGCLTRMSEDSSQPLSYDYGHLSTGAAAYYVEQLAPLIFKAP